MVFCKLSRLGVADPKIIGIFSSRALIIAMSLAEYLNPSCCLNELSCSSSTTIIPRFAKGVNTEDRVPINMPTVPSLASFHAVKRSVSVKPE